MTFNIVYENAFISYVYSNIFNLAIKGTLTRDTYWDKVYCYICLEILWVK